jgi:predicted metal-binding membrane protein
LLKHEPSPIGPLEGGRITPRPQPDAGHVVLYASAFVASGAAWQWLSGAAVSMPHLHEPDWRTFFYAVAMWQAMVVAMMTPTVLPWISTFARLTAKGDDNGSSPRAVAAFSGGYFTIWLGYSTAAAALQAGLQRLGLLADDRVVVPLAGVMLVLAGVFQFLPLKRACLSHCRNPLTYFLARWKNGPTGGFRLGVTHGAYCLGCCWLIMLSGFGVGLMNLAWMALLTVVLCLEQVAPGGERIGQAAGLAMAAWGMALILT